MKIQGYLRLVNVTRINYIMILLSLLTEASVALQRYAIDGAILIKSVEILPVTVTNEQEELMPLLDSPMYC